MSLRRLISGLVVFGLFVGAFSALRAGPPDPIVIMVSLDAFRPDYLDRAGAENLRRLADQGVRADYMLSVFPAETYPNHYSIATGLRPAHHGIIANTFLDPATGVTFAVAKRAISSQPRWWKGEPLWITAKRQGLISATVFWVGSDVPIQGEYATHWLPYDQTMPLEKRVDAALALLAKPEAERPRLIMLYMEETDTVGHFYGPDSAEIGQAIAHEDAMVGKLVAGVKALKLEDRCNFLIMSDHGMCLAEPEHTHYLEDSVDLTQMELHMSKAVAAFRPAKGASEESFERALPRKLPGTHLYKASELPADFHYTDNPMIAPYYLVADAGWRLIQKRGGKPESKALHGYDPRAESMHAFFIAQGPRIAEHRKIPAFENIHVYPLVCSLLKIKPAPSDGDSRLEKEVLRP